MHPAVLGPRINLQTVKRDRVRACPGGAAWPSAEVNSEPHDKALFEKALSAMRQKRFTVANLTLQTLVNTYPESDYTRKAKVILQDPQIEKCGESWSTDPDCDGRIKASPSSAP